MGQHRDTADDLLDDLQSAQIALSPHDLSVAYVVATAGMAIAHAILALSEASDSDG